MQLPLIDIGANLTNKAFRDDLEEVLQRASEQGVQHIVITGTCVKSSAEATQLAEQYPGLLYATAGIHPHDAKDFSSSSRPDILALSQHPSVKAIGECGLDFNRMFSSKEQQIAAFEQQIEIAIEQQLPLFLHERDAHKEQWEIIASYRDQIPAAVIHCFTGDKREAFRYLDLDLYIGITGWICDERRGHHLHNFVGDIPLNRLMIETDAPYLIPRVKPKPKLASSRRNEPCTLPYVLQEISRHRRESLEQIAQATSNNAIRFFALND
ncbi:TatD family hydrolase [Oceanicoccus sagamiensis]|uniref:Hydrolase TatD n=1 Tax=Oceanicoccus sagamiensis TaxID=716816 RepID=A0A1X9NC97_9GAMM|nr:TatD family hydrolase [Oceanicoccus sagamiensis]ARN75668.1 hydrolase TatD [Oceanicoccus sagamiensis]